jgi:hypothetical protein
MHHKNNMFTVLKLRAAEGHQGPENIRRRLRKQTAK